MKIPTSLKHKPVIQIDNYSDVDGKYAHNTNAKGLSLGLAQWSDRGDVDISAKIWRHTGEKWSRQSEEMPMHRVLDLAILICQTSKFFQEAYRHDNLYDVESPVIERIGLQGEAATVSVCTDNPMINKDIRLFAQELGHEGERLGERFAILSRLLKEMKY